MNLRAAAAVADSLKRNRARSAEYGNAMSNHLSMGVVALAGLGGSEEQIARFEARYTGRYRLRPLGSNEAGARAGEAERAEAMHAEMAADGRDPVLRRHLPQLLRGLAASAFHALIRTACGIEADDDEEIAFALAYWQGAWLDLAEPSAARQGTADLTDVLGAYGRHLRSNGLVPAGRAIFVRMQSAARDPAFAMFADSARVDAQSLPDLAALARRAFAQTLDFTALHLVTSTHALRVLSPWIADRASANRFHWRAMLAGYAAMGGRPILVQPRTPPDPGEWDKVAALAIATGDDHAIKLAYSAKCEAEGYGCDAAYRGMAAAYARKLVTA